MKRLFSFASFLFCIIIFGNTFAQSPDFSYPPTCYGSQTTLVASSSLPDTAVSQWQWDLDGNGSYELNGKMIVSFFIQNDTVAVKLKVTPVSGTADSVTKNVIIDPLPQVNFIANNLCESRSAIYASQSTIASGGIAQFLWDFNNDGVTDDNSNDTVSYICGPAQTYITKLTCVSDKGCSAFSQKTTTVYPNPVSSFTVPSVCVLNPSTFTNTSTVIDPDIFIWNFGDSSQTVNSGNINHLYSIPGLWNVSLIAVSQSGCRDTFAASANVEPLPMVQIIEQDAAFFLGGSITLHSSVSIDVVSYLWSTGETTDNITVTQTGSYSIQGTTSAGCTWSDTVSVLVNAIPDTISVSGFIVTPNDDNINDALIINNIDAYASCDLKVYNIWNDEVFSISAYKNDWKGTHNNGNALPAGAYYYIIQCDDKPMLKGNINILR